MELMPDYSAHPDPAARTAAASTIAHVCTARPQSIASFPPTVHSTLRRPPAP